jgi:hypothetical protein
MVLAVALLVAIVVGACGSDDTSVVSNVGEEERARIVRVVESSQIFTEEDFKAIGWKGQRSFVLEYPGASVYKWGFLNSKEVGILIYASADDANTLGVASANEQTFLREEDDQAPDEGIDRISCRDKHNQGSATKAIIGVGTKAFSASYLDPEIENPDDILGVTCSNRYPTYNDYTVVGNVVVLCEADGRNLIGPSTNCKEMEKWLTQ